MVTCCHGYLLSWLPAVMVTCCHGYLISWLRYWIHESGSALPCHDYLLSWLPAVMVMLLDVWEWLSPPLSWLPAVMVTGILRISQWPVVCASCCDPQWLDCWTGWWNWFQLWHQVRSCSYGWWTVDRHSCHHAKLEGILGLIINMCKWCTHTLSISSVTLLRMPDPT